MKALFGTRAGTLLVALVLAATRVASGATPAPPAAATPPASAAPIRAASTESAALHVQDAWVRVTPGVAMAAAYMTLHNSGARPAVIVGVHSSLAGHAMIHESKIEGGRSSMRPRERLVVPAGASVVLEPGGLHVMLQMLTRTPAVGEEIPLVLELEGGGTLAFSARVRPLGGG